MVLINEFEDSNCPFDVKETSSIDAFDDLIKLFTAYEDINNVVNVRRIIRCYLTMLCHENSFNWFDDVIRDLIYAIDNDNGLNKINVDFKKYYIVRDKILDTEELLVLTTPMSRWLLDCKAPYSNSLKHCIDIFSTQNVDAETMFVNVYTILRYVYKINSVSFRLQELKKYFYGLSFGGVYDICEVIIHVSTELIGYIYDNREYLRDEFDVADVLSLLSRFIENCIKRL